MVEKEEAAQGWADESDDISIDDDEIKPLDDDTPQQEKGDEQPKKSPDSQDKANSAVDELGLISSLKQQQSPTQAGPSPKDNQRTSPKN